MLMGLSVAGSLVGCGRPSTCMCIEWLDVLISSASFTHACQGDFPAHSSHLLCYSCGQQWWQLLPRLHSKAGGESQPQAPTSHTTFIFTVGTVLPPTVHPALAKPPQLVSLSPDCSSCSWTFLFGRLTQTQFFSILSLMGVEPLFVLISFTPSHTEMAPNLPSHLEVLGCYR